MKLSRASGYALQALVSMADQQDGQAPLASHLTAQAQGIPERFLLKVLKPLVTIGVLYSKKGPNGGYSLARPASRITLLEVVEAVDGPLRGEAPRGLNRDAKAVDDKLQEYCQSVADRNRRLLGKVTLAELAGKGKGKGRKG
jgi:Rrf2 family protein